MRPGRGERVRTGVLHVEPMARGDSGEVAAEKSSSVGKAVAVLSQMVCIRYRVFGYIILERKVIRDLPYQ